MSYTQYSQYSGNPYANSPAAEDGYAHVAPPTNLEPGQPGISHEMTNLSATSQYSASGAPPAAARSTTLSRQDFLTRVDLAKEQIRELASSVQNISTFHQQLLSSTDSSSTAELEGLVTKTQSKIVEIKNSTRVLETDATKTNDGNKAMKDQQAKRLKRDFSRELEAYREEELQYRKRYREQIERQIRIVNPEASDAEVAEAAQMDWGSEGVFQTALKSNRSGQASSVLGAVRARHNELQRIEQTLTELAAMFTELEQVVNAQEDVVQHTEENAIKTQEDVDRGNTEITKATEHARRRNRLRRWCILVVILIIIAIALGVGLGVGLVKGTTAATR